MWNFSFILIGFFIPLHHTLPHNGMEWIGKLSSVKSSPVQSSRLQSIWLFLGYYSFVLGMLIWCFGIAISVICAIYVLWNILRMKFSQTRVGRPSYGQHTSSTTSKWEIVMVKTEYVGLNNHIVQIQWMHFPDQLFFRHYMLLLSIPAQRLPRLFHLCMNMRSRI